MSTTFAVLGATGSTGSEVVRHLLPRPNVHIHVYARSEEKLRRMIPEIADAKNVTVFTGSLSDSATLTRCLEGVSAIFSTVAQNNNEPGCHVAQDTARVLASSLSSIREKTPSYNPPRLVFLSSASLVSAFHYGQPWLVRKFVYNGSYNVYEDLRAAEKYLADEVPWLPLIRACPGGLVPSEEVGVEILDSAAERGDDNTELHSPTVGYKDLAAAMIMMVDDKETEWRGKQVAIKSKGEPRFDLLKWNLIKFLLPGNVVSWIPAAYPFLLKIGFMQ